MEEMGEAEEGQGVKMGASMGVAVGRAVGGAILAWRRYQLEEEYGMGRQDADVRGQDADVGGQRSLVKEKDEAAAQSTHLRIIRV